MDRMTELASLVKAAHREGARELNEALSDIGVTGPQAEVLSVLRQAGPLALNELGGLLIAEGGHPSRLVDRLVAAGLVRRDAAPDDRRRVELRLTERGAEVDALADQRRRRVNARIARALEGQDLDAVRRALEAYVAPTALGETLRRRRALGAKSPA